MSKDRPFYEHVSPERWIFDFKWLLGEFSKPLEDDPQRLLAIQVRLGQALPDSSYQEYEARLGRAFGYLQEYLQLIPQCKFVDPPGTYWVPNEVLHALYLHFSQIPLEALSYYLPVESIIISAQKLIDQNKAP